MDSKYLHEDGGDFEDQVLVALRRIVRAIDLHSRQLVRQSGLTGPQLVVLRSAARMGGASLGEVAAAVSLSQATLSDVVRRLEERGLAQREREGPDRRRVRLQVTEAGRALLDRAPSLLQDRLRRALARRPAYERNQILATLQLIAEMMDAEDLEAAPMLATGPIRDAPDAGD
jgi:DNA-binding MarR family transcriptional regulator